MNLPLLTTLRFYAAAPWMLPEQWLRQVLRDITAARRELAQLDRDIEVALADVVDRGTGGTESLMAEALPLRRRDTGLGQVVSRHHLMPDTPTRTGLLPTDYSFGKAR
jgi:hypothetical protein